MSYCKEFSIEYTKLISIEQPFGSTDSLLIFLCLQNRKSDKHYEN